MNISGSGLFKDFARPVLQPEPDRNWPCYTPLGIMHSVTQYLLNRSKLEVSHVKISNPTESTCDISIECRVTGTGPVSSTVSPMDVDLVFNGEAFSKMTLPEIRTNFWGTKVVVERQTIEITKMAVYQLFVRSIMEEQETTLFLDNGECTIKALGISARCLYSIDVPMRGMEGPTIALKDVSRQQLETQMIFEFDNPSPVEIAYGRSVFHLKNMQNQVLATLQGELNIVSGKFVVTLRGTLTPGVGTSPGDKVRLVGVGTETKSWCNETIGFIDRTISLKGAVASVLR